MGGEFVVLLLLEVSWVRVVGNASERCRVCVVGNASERCGRVTVVGNASERCRVCVVVIASERCGRGTFAEEEVNDGRIVKEAMDVRADAVVVVGNASKRYRKWRSATLGGVTHYTATLGGVAHYVGREGFGSEEGEGAGGQVAWVVGDVADEVVVMAGVTDKMVEDQTLPYFATGAQGFVDGVGRKALHAAEAFAYVFLTDGREEEVNVVGHDDVVMNPVTATVVIHQRVGYYLP